MYWLLIVLPTYFIAAALDESTHKTEDHSKPRSPETTMHDTSPSTSADRISQQNQQTQTLPGS